VFFFSGEGGAGKSTLAEYFVQRVCNERQDLDEGRARQYGKAGRRKPRVPYAYVDFKSGISYTRESVMLVAHIAGTFMAAPYNIELVRFSFAWQRYQAIRPQPGVDLMGPEGTIMRMAERAVEAVDLPSLVKRAKEAVRRVQMAGARHLLPENFLQMSLGELEAYLPQALGEDLRDVAHDPRFAKNFACQRPVLIFDTFEMVPREDPAAPGPSAEIEEAVRQICRHAEGALVVICGRRELEWDGEPAVEEHPVEELTEEACIEYLKLRNVPDNMYGPIYQFTRGHALFVGICGDWCEELIQQGRQPKPEDLDVSRADESFEEKLRYLLDRLIRDAGEDKRELLEFLAIPLAFDRELLFAAMEPAKRPHWRGRFGEVVGLSFVVPVRDVEGFYQLHPAVREIWVRWYREDQPEAFRAGQTRLKEAIEGRLDEAEPGTRWWLMACLGYAAALGEGEDRAQAIEKRVEEAVEQGHGIDAHGLASGWAEGARLAEIPLTKELLYWWGRGAYMVGAWGEATLHLQRAFEIAVGEQDRAFQAAALRHLGILCRRRGHPKRAMGLYEQSLNISRDVGDKYGEAAALHEIAVIYASWGEYDRAMELYEQSLAIKRELVDRRGEAATLHQMAGICARRGETAHAMKLYEESLKTKRELGDRLGEAATLHQMGVLEARLGHSDRAMELYEESLAIKRSLGVKSGVARTLHRIAAIHAERGDYDLATKLCEESLKIERSIGKKLGEARTLSLLVVLYARKGRRPKLCRPSSPRGYAKRPGEVTSGRRAAGEGGADAVL